METREEKAARMAAALRANLRKRKDQARGERALGSPAWGEGKGAGDAPPAPSRDETEF